MSKRLKSFNEPTEKEIALLAYQLWEADGRCHGRDREHWLQARAHLMAPSDEQARLLGAVREEPADGRRGARQAPARRQPAQGLAVRGGKRSARSPRASEAVLV